jgi:hypothetical protein
VQERRAAELRATECCDSIQALVRKANSTAEAPRRVYEWLCGYTHLDSLAIMSPLSHEEVYAGIAYMGLLCAVVAEAVAGWSGVAQWPAAWPARLPWA